MRFVLMGVSGCGKSSVGQAVAQHLSITFADGDDLHPQANINKMSRGEPLNDADRAPWLAKVGRHLQQATGPMGIACSALTRSYRDIIRTHAGTVHFLHLHAPQDVLAQRVANRTGHFMPLTLLDSQYQTLQMLDDDEDGTLINIDQPYDAVVADAVLHVQALLDGSKGQTD